MPTGTRPAPTPEEEQIAALLRAALAEKIPPWSQLDLSRATGIEASILSRVLRAKRGLAVFELLRITSALGLDAGALIDEARRRVRESGASVAVQPEPHSTTVTVEDIAAGAGLPLVARKHRRSAPSNGTRTTRHR